MITHDAFISYSHTADHELARELERALEQFAKPWYKRRALDVFRDEGNLNLTPHLWGGIEQALDRSRYVIHLASKAAAASPWVHRELEHWMGAKSARQDRLLLVVTEGDLVWDDARGDFDRAASTAISPALHGAFAGVPFYLDLRWAAAEGARLRDHPRLRNAVVALVAAIRQQPAEDLAGEDAAQHRRTLRVRNAALGALTLLSLAALGGAWVAADRAREATRQRGIAEREATTARTALARLSMDVAARQLGTGRHGGALAYLARAARSDPESLARDWIAELVFNDPFWLPGPPLSHAASVVSAALTPDGTRVVTASVDGTARIWSLASGTAIGMPMTHDGPIAMVAVSPDGRVIATTSSDRTARLWDATSGAPVAPPLHHDWKVRHVAFSPDGRRLVTTTHGHAQVWDTATAQAVTPPLDHGSGEALDAAAFSPDGRLIVTGAADYTARGWDAATGAAIGLVRHRSDVFDVEFSPDGQRLLTASSDRTAQLWDATTGAPVGTPLRHTGFVESAEFSADGRLIVTASSDGTARIWDATTQTPVGPPLQHQAEVWSARFSRDGRLVVTASSDHTARVWSVDTAAPVGRALEHTDGVRTAMFTPDGRAVVTASEDKTARVWALPAPTDTRLTIRHGTGIGGAEFNRDGSRVLATADRSAHIWEAETGRLVVSTPPTANSLTGALLSPDERRLLTMSRGEVRLWDAATGGTVGAPVRDANEGTFSVDSRHVLVTSDTSAWVYDASTGTPVAPPSALRSAVVAAYFLPDGTVALIGEAARHVWNLETATLTASPWPAGLRSIHPSPSGRFVITEDQGDIRLRDGITGAALGSSMPHLFPVPGIALSPDERLIVTSSGNSARVWELPSGQPVTPLLQHADGVQSMAFSPDGRRLVTVCRDGTARIWDATAGVAVGTTFSHPRSMLRTATFSPDGRRLLTASLDGSITLWTIALDLPAGEGPDVVADIAELVAGQRVSARGALEPVPVEDWRRLWTRVTGLQVAQPATRDLLIGRFRRATAAVTAGAVPPRR